jgi:hypothetical protein
MFLHNNNRVTVLKKLNADDVYYNWIDRYIIECEDSRASESQSTNVNNHISAIHFLSNDTFIAISSTGDLFIHKLNEFQGINRIDNDDDSLPKDLGPSASAVFISSNPMFSSGNYYYLSFYSFVIFITLYLHYR